VRPFCTFQNQLSSGVGGIQGQASTGAAATRLDTSRLHDSPFSFRGCCCCVDASWAWWLRISHQLASAKIPNNLHTNTIQPSAKRRAGRLQWLPHATLAPRVGKDPPAASLRFTQHVHGAGGNMAALVALLSCSGRSAAQVAPIGANARALARVGWGSLALPYRNPFPSLAVRGEESKCEGGTRLTPADRLRV